jgi:hypothetical protein
VHGGVRERGAAAHPVERRAPRRVGVVGGRVHDAQQVAARPTQALRVLDRLERELLDRLLEVAVGDRAPQPTAPAARAVHRVGELKEMRADARHPGQRLQRGRALRLLLDW